MVPTDHGVHHDQFRTVDQGVDHETDPNIEEGNIIKKDRDHLRREGIETETENEIVIDIAVIEEEEVDLIEDEIDHLGVQRKEKKEKEEKHGKEGRDESIEGEEMDESMEMKREWMEWWKRIRIEKRDDIKDDTDITGKGVTEKDIIEKVGIERGEEAVIGVGMKMMIFQSPRPRM